MCCVDEGRHSMDCMEERCRKRVERRFGLSLEMFRSA